MYSEVKPLVTHGQRCSLRGKFLHPVLGGRTSYAKLNKVGYGKPGCPSAFLKVINIANTGKDEGRVSVLYGFVSVLGYSYTSMAAVMVPCGLAHGLSESHLSL